jgi:hypothetical protein
MSIPFGAKVILVFLDDALNFPYLPFAKSAIVGNLNWINPEFRLLIISLYMHMLLFSTVIRPEIKPKGSFNKHGGHDVVAVSNAAFERSIVLFMRRLAGENRLSEGNRRLKENP